jgi:outer membrane protein OmpA-like peptidoglycan-associated protein
MTRLRTIIALAALVSFGAGAQTVIHFKEGQRVDPASVSQILASAQIRTRSIRLLDEGPGDASLPSAPAAEAATPSALSLPVRFNFDSAEIAPSARPQLDALAEGIKMLPPGTAVLVEGHTDAVGSDAYNLTLSRRRALSVKRYLHEVHGIDNRRLVASGVGEQQPIDGADPMAAENRRVQFRGL